MNSIEDTEVEVQYFSGLYKTLTCPVSQNWWVITLNPKRCEERQQERDGPVNKGWQSKVEVVYHIMSVFLCCRIVFVPTECWLSLPVLMPLCALFGYDHWNLLWLRLNLRFPIRLLNIRPISDMTSNCQALRLMPRLASPRCDVTGQLFLSVELRWSRYMP